MKLKIFKGYTSSIEELNEQINDWMISTNIEIYNTLQSMHDGCIVISIFHKELEKIEYLKS